MVDLCIINVYAMGKNEMDKNKHNYLSSLSKIDLFKSIENRFVAFSKQEGVDSYNSINSDRTIENELICVATIDDLVGIGDNKLRNLIVYDKTNYENTVILDLLRLADCVYFVEEQNCINQFTMNCIIGHEKFHMNSKIGGDRSPLLEISLLFHY